MVNKIPFVSCWGKNAPPGSAPGPQLVNQNKCKSSRFQSRIEQKHLQREINFITVICGVYLSPQVGLRWNHKKYVKWKFKRRDKASSLHSKKFFLLRAAFFCEWRYKWRTFRPPWPTLPGPGRQPLGSSISMKFLLETRLLSESFDTLDDLLRFRVQKLWWNLVKIFD